MGSNLHLKAEKATLLRSDRAPIFMFSEAISTPPDCTGLQQKDKTRLCGSTDISHLQNSRILLAFPLPQSPVYFCLQQVTLATELYLALYHLVRVKRVLAFR